MSTTIKERRTALLKKAKGLLDKGFVRGRWIIFPDGTEWSPHGKTNKGKLESLRKKLGTYPNPPECKVCAEGALYLAVASDPEATETDLVNVFGHARGRARSLYGERSIPGVNDHGGRSLKEVSKLFESEETKTKEKA